MKSLPPITLIATTLLILAACAAPAPSEDPIASSDPPEVSEDANPPEEPATPQPDKPTVEVHPTRCQTTQDCVAISLTRECCSACTDIAYARDYVPQLRAHCDANPDLRSQCPALGCAFEPATATCVDGHCRAITSGPSVFGF